MDHDPRTPPQTGPGSACGPTAPQQPPRRRRSLVLLLAGLAVSVYLLDQVTKWIAVDQLTDRPPVPVVGDLLQLRLVYNPGAAFGLGTGLTWLLTLLATVVVVVVVRMAARIGSRGWAVALGLLLAGASGNLTDRLVREPGFARGHVVDFLALPNFPVFNVADSAITVAAAMIVVLGLRGIGLDGRREGDAGSGRDTGSTQDAGAAGDHDDERPPGA